MLTAGITGSRRDEGNISYELHEVAGDPGTFIFYEQWISQDALDAHLATPALKKLKEQAPESIEGGFEAGMRLLKKVRPAAGGQLVCVERKGSFPGGIHPTHPRKNARMDGAPELWAGRDL